MKNVLEHWYFALEQSSEKAVQIIEKMGYSINILDINTKINLKPKEMVWFIDFPIEKYLKDPKQIEYLLTNNLMNHLVNSFDKMGWTQGDTIPIKWLNTWTDDPLIQRQRMLGAYGWVDGFVKDTELTENNE